MSSRVYSAVNGAMVTTASPVPITTSTSIKTLQQLATSSTMSLEVIEWGISFDGSAAATPGICELVDTVAVNSTVTAYVAADITKVSQSAAALASGLTLAVAGSGFTASSEGTITATRQFDTQLLPPTAPYIKQFPLERGPVQLQSEFLRVRVKFGTAINALCYIIWQE
jgi:hypothetical protein